jgi:hypothetical protein
VAACSEAVVKAVACFSVGDLQRSPGPGMRWWHALGQGLRTEDDGGGMMVSRATEERESGDEKLLSVARESAGLKF